MLCVEMDQLDTKVVSLILSYLKETIQLRKIDEDHVESLEGNIS
jgi:hypothetical protein